MPKKRWFIWSVVAALALLGVAVLSGGQYLAPVAAQSEGLELAVYNQNLALVFEGTGLFGDVGTGEGSTVGVSGFRGGAHLEFRR